MNVTMHFCMRSLRQINHAAGPKYNCTAKMRVLSTVYKRTKLTAVTLSQTASKKLPDDTREKIEVLLIKNPLAGNKLDHKSNLVTKGSGRYQNVSAVEKRPCSSEKGQCNYKSQLVWQDILLGQKHIGTEDQILGSNLIGISDEMWYCSNIDNDCPKKHLKYTEVKESLVAERKKNTGPSSDQLSIVLLRLREELPNFFEGHHQYSIYSKNILFVNKLTRTTTRTLKSYQYIMKLMSYCGRLFWTKASLDIIRITKHAEDNTIKVRWTAKGVPWHQLPFFLLSGKPQSLFYRYVDGFSIFEVGRDGLVHCHRLDKVMPTSTPERQKWSIRMQVLALLGLGEITHEPCEAFQVKTQEMIK